MWFQKASPSGAAGATALQPQSQKHISWWREDVCASASFPNYCSVYLSVFITAERTCPSTPWPRFRGHDSWCVHPQPHQTSNVFITVTFRWHQFCLNQKRGGEKKVRRMGKREWTGECGWTERAAIHLSIHQRGDAALQISWSSFVMFSACQWP